MRNSRRDTLPRAKIKTPQELQKIISRLKYKGKRIVFTNGCFDLLHYGHVKYLADAKKKGDILIVALNSDASVKRIKGDKRPIINEQDRLRTIAALESVDYAVLFKEDTPLKLIKLLKPDMLVKGADWNKDNIVGAQFLSSYGGKVSTIKLIRGRSSTLLLKKIKKIASR